MANCNHVWRDTPLPTPKKTKDDLYSSAKNVGTAGWWLNKIENDFALELVAEGKAAYCEICNRKAILAITDA